MKAFKFAKTVLKSMFKKPATLMYPVVEREWQDRTRGQIGIEEDSCILCGICAKRCPADAISVDRKDGKWEIERMRCIQCGECVEACPKKCLNMEKQYTEPGPEKVIHVHEIEVKKPAKPAAPKADAPAESGDAAAEASADDADDTLVCDLNACVFCGLCAKNCPCDALKVDRKEKIWELDEDACVKCGACIDKCPKKCLSFGAPAAGAEEAEELAKKVEDSEAADENKAAAAVVPEFDAEKCIYCGVCENQCPCEAISAEMDAWTLDKEACIGCGACVDVCPAEALKM